MFLGLDRAGKRSQSLRTPNAHPLPRVHPRLYGGSCVRGSNLSCYRRIRRARLSRPLSLGRAPHWRHWCHPRRWNWAACVHRIPSALTTLRNAIPPASFWLQILRGAVPSSALAQWYVSFAVPTILFVAGETSQLRPFSGGEANPFQGMVAARSGPPLSALTRSPSHPAAAQTLASLPGPEGSHTGSTGEIAAAWAEREPQPLLADAAAEPFPALARLHRDWSIATFEALRLHQGLEDSALRAKTAQRLAEEEARAQLKLKRHKVLAQALQVGKLRLESPSKATLRLEIYDSFASLERGTPDVGEDADLFSVNFSGQRWETVDRYAGFVSAGGPIEVTNYGYAADFTGDRNSNRFATGLGGTRPLIPGISAALSTSLANKLDAKAGAVIEFVDGAGRSFLVTYDDRSPQGNLNIDVYRPTFGSNNFRAHVRAARVLRQGSVGICHSKEGLPFSLQNYRDALLQLAGENRLEEPESEDSLPGLESESPAHLSDFDQVEDSLPLAQRLDGFANTPFAETGFDTRQEVARYLEAGALALQQGVALVRKHGLKPAEFPPIQRMRANLEEAQEARQAIAAGEARLKLAYEECETEIFRIKMQASLEDDALILAEVHCQLEELECTQTDILAQLESQGGGLLRPVPGRGRPTQVTSNHPPWSWAPES